MVKRFAKSLAEIAAVLAAAGLILILVGGYVPELVLMAILGALMLPVAGLMAAVALVLAVVSRATARLFLLAIVALLLSAAGMAVTIVPVIRSARIKAHQVQCIQHQKDLAMAMLLYAHDYDERFPRASIWCDTIRPRVSSPESYRCPEARHLRSGYAMNRALDCRSLSSLEEPGSTVALFDATGGWNSSGGRELLAKRHVGGAIISFADGHVKWIRLPEQQRWEVANEGK